MDDDDFAARDNCPVWDLNQEEVLLSEKVSKIMNDPEKHYEDRCIAAKFVLLPYVVRNNSTKVPFNIPLRLWEHLEWGLHEARHNAWVSAQQKKPQPFTLDFISFGDSFGNTC